MPFAALDWGTSSLRAYLINDNGAVIRSEARPWGIQALPEGGYEAALAAILAGLKPPTPDLPIVASGMVGSRGGWREVPYVPCPADPATLAAGSLTVDSSCGPVHLVPGVIQNGALPNVMRGEETQILGALAVEPELARHSLIVLPGTHCKWVNVRNGLIESFSTHMTGELFAILREHSILGRPFRDAGANPPSGGQTSASAAFQRGLRNAREAGAEALSGRLFSTRSLFLSGELQAEHTLEYLSGLLIGEEIRSALAAHQLGTAIPPIVLIGDRNLCARYAASFAEFGIKGVRMMEETAPRGLWTIWSAHLPPES